MTSTNPEKTEVSTEQVSELDTLKAEADLLKITYHPKIGLEKLKLKLENHNSKDKDVPTEKKESKPKLHVATDQILTESQYQKNVRNSKRKEASKLIRVRVNCMNPNKNDWEGEIISVGSAKLGTFKKYVPFNSEEGYHIPNIILLAMKERKCTVFHTIKGPRGDKIRKGRLINEFAIEILEPLTGAELKELASQQAMAGSID